MYSKLKTESLIRLRRLQTQVQPLPHIFEATQDVLTALHDFELKHKCGMSVDAPIRSKSTWIVNTTRQIASLDRNAQYLLKRLECAAQMFTDGLALKAQKAAQHQTMLSSRQNEVLCRDSATIRVITVATLIFLPSTFVSVSRLTFTRELNDIFLHYTADFVRQRDVLLGHSTSFECLKSCLDLGSGFYSTHDGHTRILAAVEDPARSQPVFLDSLKSFDVCEDWRGCLRE
jgi:hypothetical protein